uniref:Uncharacterized protein n=1 Tax=Rhizophagus irregularis (strain DAOM 181602 / DAOM 197198 / MUCL 43194) TaxID=747089 RepID=U9TGX2_RHIID
MNLNRPFEKYLVIVADGVLDEDDLKIIEKEKITGVLSQENRRKLHSFGLSFGPASDLASFAKELGNRKLKSFSLYRSLKDLSDVPEKYGIVSGDITRIPQFIPPTPTSTKANIIGEENTGRVDNAIKKNISEGIYSTSRIEYRIP